MKVAIIGAGPAGLSAARELIKANNPVVIFDANPRSGGQYWRHGVRDQFPDQNFASLVEERCIDWKFGSSIWQVEKLNPGFRIHYVMNQKSHSLDVEKILIASGASERVLPFKNWTAPGVFTAGAAQAMAKEHQLLLGKTIVIAGSGVFALPVAKSLLALADDVGREITIGIVEARSFIRWWRNIPGFLLNPRKALEALEYLNLIRKKRIKRYMKSVVTEAVIKSGEISAVRVARLNRSLEIRKNIFEIECDFLATSFGFVPDMTIASIMGIERIFQKGDAVIRIDKNQRTSLVDVWAAGEVTGIGGHDLAVTEGALAALDILRSNQTFTTALLRWRRFRQRFFSIMLSRIYPIDSKWITWQESSVVICRCEEVSLEEIKKSVTHLGADSARSAKLFTRAGMGLCQGRMCQRNVQDIADHCAKFSTDNSRSNGKHSRDPNRETIRPIGGVVTLGELLD
jgi:NADPH-dependent 2,4-dienoyl-CoA reductase/sulfur reductase-like enzyme